jgi:cyclic beta-1,2-glucan synthetase
LFALFRSEGASHVTNASPVAPPAASAALPTDSSAFIDPFGDELIRRDLHGPDHLEALARQLAEVSVLAPRDQRGLPLLRHFARLGRELNNAHRQIRDAFQRGENTGPETEWLLDNFHIIQDSLREIREDLPQGYYRKLPKLATGRLAGYPRVYALSLSLIAHTDSGLDEDHILRFVQAYQSVTPLTTGELWAVPIMLRLALLENLRRLGRHILQAWQDRQEAVRLVENVQRFVEEHNHNSHHTWTEENVWDKFFQSLDCGLRDPFVVHSLEILRDHALGKAGLEWLEQRLDRHGLDADQVFRRESQRLAANQVCVGNCVTSLRLLSALDWNVFFEKVSPVEKVLRGDPAGIYARQDFATRDRYRQVIERLARGSEMLEQDIARLAVERARRNLATTPVRDGTAGTEQTLPRSALQAHVGYFLLGEGQAELAAAVSYRPQLQNRLLDAVLRHPHLVYFGGLGLVLAALLGILLAVAVYWSASVPVLILLLLAALLPASELAAGTMNYLVTVLLPPRVLPKLDFKDGIPTDCATCIVMPTMLTHANSAAQLLERLEVHYLANPDPHLCFALLTDFADAPTEHLPTDEAYVQAALEGIRRLNQEYCAGGPPRFFLFHRKRLWNPSEGCWMGWERKRGKLQEFNRLLRGQPTKSLALRSGELPFPIRYVITLDMDTQLPREAAMRLVGTLAHPLNEARFDAAQGRVVKGYGILQPRVNIDMLAAARSLFAHIYANSAGIDPYTSAVSDVYQDLFGVGSYIGKGIYDVDAFEAAAGQRFQENSILSHDLIEGNFARCALVTDIQLLDDFPSRYHVFARREHRWIRGDWQILPWLFGRQRGGSAADNPLPFLERWKIFDNLRRSLISTGLLLLLLAGWTVLPGSPWFWTLAAVLVPLWPLLALTVERGRALLMGRPLLSTWHEWHAELPATSGQAFLTLVFLVDQTRLSLDAIVRTLYRLTVSRRRLLEWETAASAEQRLGHSFVHFYRTMWPTVLLTCAIGVVVFFVQPAALPAAALLLLGWLGSPLVAFWVSQPRQHVEPALSAEDRQELRLLARQTWNFFETFVGEEDHFLPPDNYQEYPEGKVAHRTSPTNMGLLLLSTLAARDFGYLSVRRLLDRLEKTFDTLDHLDRYQGHFHNWYDTLTLRSLQPIYISTVDSGNLLGCLLALRQGLLELREQPLLSDALREGLADTLRLAGQALEALTPEGRTQKDGATSEENGRRWKLQDDVSGLQRLLQEKPANALEWWQWLHRLEGQVVALQERTQKLEKALHEDTDEFHRWVQCFLDQVRDQRAELLEVAPWLEALAKLDPAVLEQRQEAYAPFLALVSLAGLSRQQEAWLAVLEHPAEKDAGPSVLKDLVDAVRNSGVHSLLERCESLAARAAQFAAEMDFSALYNKQRHLFAVGYNFTLGRLDNAHYDLLASEASLTSFLAIARGEAPRRHWFQLGRPLTRTAGHTALLSWGGTMFEYLMPHLLLTALPETLLAESIEAAVDRQIEYGRHRHVPWGVSESGFSTLDAALDYQYQSFGVPGLGLRRGLGQDLVIAPYATLLALKVRPQSAVHNLRRLAEEDAKGPYGYYEAIDYTPSRMPPKTRCVVVRSYMAHHQGMGFIAIANHLLGGTMPRRFHNEPMVRATELLLQERMPRTAPRIEPPTAETPVAAVPHAAATPLSRRLTTPFTPHPRTHLLSNGQYTVMLTNAGGSWSYCRGLDVTRWREDCTRDHWGQFCYIKDLRNGKFWSAGYHPLGVPADLYEVIFSADKVEFHRIDGKIETHLEVTVSPETNCEVRRVTLTNHDSRTHDLELTSYAELVLAPHAADLSHPVFGKLFLETEYVPAVHTLLCRRRPRSDSEKPVWAAHILAVEGEPLGEVRYETDRNRFLGRGRTPADPAALDEGATLSGTTGAVLDPVFSLRLRMRAKPGTSVSLAFTTAFADTREEALALADACHDFHGITRAFELAWAHSQVELQHYHLTTEDIHLFQRLASHLIYSGPFLRAAPPTLSANQQGQSGLWKHGISGDRPIALLYVEEVEQLPLVRQLLLAHTYWRAKGLEVDLVILNQHASGYFEELHQQLQTLVRTSNSHGLIDKPGGVFVRKADALSQDDQLLLEAAARVVLSGSQGALGPQLDAHERAGPPSAPEGEGKKLSTSMRHWKQELMRPEAAGPPRPTGEKLLFANGYGGFTQDGMEYVIVSAVAAGRPVRTPAPWINVIANAKSGFLVSERGSGYTWTGNSQANRLTPWKNDPVCDPPSEVVYLRDEITGDIWTTPARTGAECRHGQGYSIFRQNVNGIESELLLTMPLEDPVKLVRLTVRNPGRQGRRLSVTFYAEWVLGTVRDNAALHVVCEVDAETGALLARNAFNTDFKGVAFADVNLRPRTLTADRTEFLGRNGRLHAPAALAQPRFSGRAAGGLDPCAALRVSIDLPPGKSSEVVFLLGQAADVAEVRRLVGRYRAAGQVDAVYAEVRSYWDNLLTTVQVRTPNAALDLMLNRWLLYQTYSCRYLARSAFYQSGGAYGFRDQLQDVMALLHAAPQETRRHILRAAARQFVEGDVQHWWHPPTGRGVRTRFSDDFLWLPFVVHRYVKTTGDSAILDEKAPFLQAPLLKPDQDEDYGLPQVSSQTGTIYEHCVRAIENGLRFGEHGLPLMGTGDWNDGMNRVGAGGKGETVWGAWFLVTILTGFADLAEQHSDGERAARYRQEAERLHKAVEEHAWDGQWYRRAYFDDGSPLGSASCVECKIDSLAQTWAVISGKADEKRAREAMASVERLLIKDRERLILLFTPPFDKGPQHPGYIRGYVPGIRENGGQYTHGATWVVLATALLGEGTRAVQLFDLLNPILYATTPAEVQRYRVEPYVAVADVYSEPPHVGRGGWSWYTGTSGWLYRIGLETILGFQVEGKRLRLNPCVGRSFTSYEIDYRYGKTVYHIRVENPQGVERGVRRVELDGAAQEGGEIGLVDDGKRHEVRVVMG